MDLFTPIVPPERFHENFARILSRNTHHDFAVVQQWAEGFVDRDGKFVHEFQTTFNSSFWELYLYAALKELRCVVDFNHHAPDFVVNSPIPFTMEAVIASNAEGALKESEPYVTAMVPDDLNEFNRLAMLRLTNALDSKVKKYQKSYHALPHVKNKPFIIAINAFDQPFSYLQMYRAIEAVLYGYYVDEESHIKGGRQGILLGQEIESVQKTPEVSIPVGFFNDAKNSFVSAVVFNSCATWGKVRALSEDPNEKVIFEVVVQDFSKPEPRHISSSKKHYREWLLDGLRVYHNDRATHPLDASAFRAPGVYQGTFDLTTNERVYQGEGEMLVFRKLITFFDPKE